VSSWEQAISQRLSILRLDSIRNKILMFAVLATLLPSLTTAWISYVENKRALQAKASEELLGLSAQAALAGPLDQRAPLRPARVFELL